MPETVWLTPFIHVPKPDDGAELRYSQEAVDQVLNFFGLLVFGQNEWAGQPFELLPWEEQLIREFYGVQVKDDDGRWVRYRRFLYNEIPKKNGKSELAAGLGLYHLLADGENKPNVGIFAVDKQNADIIYQCAKYMVEHTALNEPAHRLVPGQRAGDPHKVRRPDEGILRRCGKQARPVFLRYSLRRAARLERYSRPGTVACTDRRLRRCKSAAVRSGADHGGQ